MNNSKRYTVPRSPYNIECRQAENTKLDITDRKYRQEDTCMSVGISANITSLYVLDGWLIYWLLFNRIGYTEYKVRNIRKGSRRKELWSILNQTRRCTNWIKKKLRQENCYTRQNFRISVLTMSSIHDM